MTPSEYWSSLITDLQDQITVARIAQEISTTPRQVWLWKSARCSPSSICAIRIYLLHVKLCADKQRDLSQIA